MRRRVRSRHPITSSPSAVAAISTKRNSSGTTVRSAAYLARKARPKKSMTIPARASGLPPLNHRSALAIPRSSGDGDSGAVAGTRAHAGAWTDADTDADDAG
jgi:hypothetical protein